MLTISSSVLEKWSSEEANTFSDAEGYIIEITSSSGEHPFSSPVSDPS